MYAIVWSETSHVGVVAAGMDPTEGKRLAIMVLTVLPTVCAHCRQRRSPAQFFATKQGEEAQT